MPPSSAYYDTCIFLESLNETHRESGGCKDLLTPSLISWVVQICAELSKGESTAAEFIDNFEVDCAANGVHLMRVSLVAARRTAKRHVALKKSLSRRGFTSRDWIHLMAATASRAE